MNEWILPILNIIVLVLIFKVSTKNREAKFHPYDFFTADRGVIYLFWSPGCGHCKRLKDPNLGGKWPMFLTRAKNAGIPVQEVEMREGMSPDELALLKIVGPMPGVPYIVRLKSGRAPEPYQGPRDDESLMSWALA